ncbi:DUF7010 family protein [Sediminivirga luteola]|nr:hypothetical protein [Sediminivirga luteola]MCI2266252.1 hypothetical protein [Sediminivirga luteola]
MEIQQAQADVRRVYYGGSVGPWVSSVLWCAAAAAGTWGSDQAAMVTLFFGGMLIMPVSLLIMRLGPGENALPKGHPMNALATQTAMTVPIGLLVALALGISAPHLFFPAALAIVGAHYLPFVFLYGQKLFAVLGILMVLAGVVLTLGFPEYGIAGGWIGAALLLIFGFVLHRAPR